MRRYNKQDEETVMKLYKKLNNNTIDNLVKETGFGKSFINNIINKSFINKKS